MSSRSLGHAFPMRLLAVAVLLSIAASGCTDRGDRAVEAFDSKDYDEAMDLWMPLAEEGDADAQFGVAYLYEHGLGVPPDATEAARWYRLSAEQGHASSQLNLGTLYEAGRAGFAADPGRAADWYRMAAEQENPKAQYYLGRMYLKGDGLPQNHELAFEWVQKAVDQGHLEAIAQLGFLYVRGIGVERDLEQGFELTRRAAEMGDRSAQLNLATLYVSGTGTEQDYVEALKWISIFNPDENRPMGLPMDWVDTNMTAEQIEEAQRRAEAWLAEHPREEP